MSTPFKHPTFPTDEGFCSITPDALVFSRLTDAGRDLIPLWRGAGLEKRVIMVILVGIVVMLGLRWIGLDPVFFLLYVAVILIREYFSRRTKVPTTPVVTETTSRIERDDIVSVTAYAPDPPRERGRIVVLYERDDVSRQRTITLPATTGDGFDEYEAAIETLTIEGVQMQREDRRETSVDANVDEQTDFILDHPTFRTRSCFCSITPEKIIFTRPTGIDSLMEPLARNSGRDSRLLKVVAGTMMIIIGLVQFYNESTLYGILFILSGAVQIAYIFIPRVPEPITVNETSITSSIDRADIVSVTAIEPDPPRTRGTIVIRYERDGETRQRTIELEQNVGDGDEELAEAVGVMRLAGIPMS